MRPGLMIIIEVTRQSMTQVTLIDDDQMVQTLSPDTADNPFRKRILPGTPHRRDHLFDPHSLNTVLEILSVDSVAIAQQISGSFIVGKGIDDLLSCPFGSRI